MKKRLLAVSAALFFVLAGGGFANASLLLNGGFDDEIGLTGNSWSVFDEIPSWKSGSGTGIEVQRSTVVGAHTPYQYVELDSHDLVNDGVSTPTNSSMYQTVYLTAGKYELSWMYHARTNRGGDDNGIEAFLTSSSLVEYDGPPYADSSFLDSGIYLGNISKLERQQRTTWEEVVWNFYLEEEGSYNLWFAAFGLENTLGGFVDSVALNMAPVPEPSTLLLLGAGLVGLATVRRRRLK